MANPPRTSLSVEQHRHLSRCYPRLHPGPREGDSRIFRSERIDDSALRDVCRNSRPSKYPKLPYGTAEPNNNFQVDAAIVGIAFTRQNVTQEFSSNYSLGGGVGLSYKQLNPPGQLPGSITDAMSLYASWSKDLAKEPLPQLRDFFMDRDKIQELGDMSAKALKIQKDITCTGRLLDIDGKLKTESDTKTLRIKTNFPANEETDKDNLVTIRLQPRLTLWVDNIVYKSNSNAISTIIFASINGDIENGSKTLSTPEMKAAGNYTNGISAVACNVDVKLVDSNFSIGEGCSSLSTVSRFGSISSGSGKLDNRHVAAWFGLAAVTNGVSVYGAQPMFNNKDKGLPSMFTSISNATDTQKRWTIDQLKEFINVSSGALAITMSRQSADEKVILHSRKETLQLDPMRAYILLAPPIALLILILLLVVTVVWFYRKDRIPNMCLVQVGDLVAFTQTSDISVNARTASGTNKDSSKLGEMKVKYGITNEGQVGLGCPETVSSFD